MNNQIHIENKDTSYRDTIQAKFHYFAQVSANAVGSPYTFVLSFIGVMIWAISGPIFNFSDTWQLIINTSTTVVTFLMVCLIQHTQNRDGRAIHLKLDELIRANKHARNHLIDLQNLSDSELDSLHNELNQLQKITDAKINNLKVHKIERQNKIKKKRKMIQDNIV